MPVKVLIHLVILDEHLLDDTVTDRARITLRLNLADLGQLSVLNVINELLVMDLLVSARHDVL